MINKIIDREGFKEVFDEYYLPLCHFLKTYSYDKSLIEDIVQEVFLKLWNKRSQFEIENIKSYLFTACKNEYFDYQKKIKRTNSYKKSQLLEKVVDNRNFDEICNSFLIKQKIYNSLRHLSPKTREIFEYNKLKGLTYTEIADKLNISVKTVEAHMSKSFKIIRSNWEY